MCVAYGILLYLMDQKKHDLGYFDVEGFGYDKEIVWNQLTSA